MESGSLVQSDEFTWNPDSGLKRVIYKFLRSCRRFWTSTDYEIGKYLCKLCVDLQEDKEALAYSWFTQVRHIFIHLFIIFKLPASQRRSNTCVVLCSII